jgi:XTP/dITP diphosphohydrolase
MKSILLASQNLGKVKEINEIFNDGLFKILSLRGIEDVPDVIEDGKTFETNARKKAKEYYETFLIPVIADDSGLAVEQLLDAPGVYSARYSGENATDEENNKKLLSELNNHPEPHPAKFVCSAVYYDGKRFLVANDYVSGQIIKEPRGTNGFGYDPLFLPDGNSKTSGELTLAEKNQISHRAKAFRKLKELILKETR